MNPLNWLKTPKRQSVRNLTKIGPQLFCGHDRGAFLIEGETAELISTIKGAWRY